MDSTKRLLLALALSFGATAMFMWLTPKAPPTSPDLDGGAEVAAPSKETVPSVPSPAAPTAPGAGVEAAAPPAEVKKLPRKEQDVNYIVSTVGAGLVQAELQGEKMREQRQLNMAQGYKLLAGGTVPDAPQMDMATADPGLPPSLAVAVNGSSPLDAKSVWTVVESESGPDKMVFSLNQGPWQAKKVLEWPKSEAPGTPASRGYEIAMTVSLTNTSANPVQGELGVGFHRAVDPTREEKASLFGGAGNESKATCFAHEKLLHLVPENKPIDAEKLTGPIRFFGVDQQYFLGTVFVPEDGRNGRCEMIATPGARGAVGWFPLNVKPGETAVQKFGVYVGPKDSDYLKQEPTPTLGEALGVSAGNVNAQLAKTVDFGIWEFLCVILLAVLKFFHGVTANWGIAIVLLTLVVKVVLLPLTVKSMAAAENMKKLQPRVEEIRKKFGEDPARMNQETMKLYQEAKVNPLGGCLPMLLQMPVWIALFTTLRNSYEIYREPFFGPVWRDLTFKDPTYILPLLLGVTMILTQRLQPAMMDKAQQRIMTWFMPILFTGMMLAYPAGLTLYIFTNNVLSIVQQYGVKKWLEARGQLSTVEAKR